MCIRDSSTPQPKVSLGWRVLEYLVRVVIGVLLVYVSLALLLAAVEDLLRMPAIQNGLLALDILLVVLWWLWSKLPDWFRKAIRRSLKRKERSHER